MVFAVVGALSVRQRFLVFTVRFIALSTAYTHDTRTVSGVPGRPGGPSAQGVCSYGGSPSCCLGWRNVNGICQPMCREPCVNGLCVGPDKCSCSEGYRGQLCDQDVNECGLPERPCAHLCMNTAGSYRCYCDPGHALNADAHTCTREPECSTVRCQFGCQIEGGGEVRCLCPPGLHLAPDERTCEDVDECLGSSEVCPARRTCKNTFGSFVCVCEEGFVLGTLQDSVQCRDMDECLMGSHRCNTHTQCVNTEGSYSCRCIEGYFGDGYTCHPRSASQSKASQSKASQSKASQSKAMYFQYKLSKRTRPSHPSALKVPPG